MRSRIEELQQGNNEIQFPLRNNEIQFPLRVCGMSISAARIQSQECSNISAEAEKVNADAKCGVTAALEAYDAADTELTLALTRPDSTRVERGRAKSAFDTAYSALQIAEDRQAATSAHLQAATHRKDSACVIESILTNADTFSALVHLSDRFAHSGISAEMLSLARELEVAILWSVHSASILAEAINRGTAPEFLSDHQAAISGVEGANVNLSCALRRVTDYIAQHSADQGDGEVYATVHQLYTMYAMNQLLPEDGKEDDGKADVSSSEQSAEEEEHVIGPVTTISVQEIFRLLNARNAQVNHEQQDYVARTLYDPDDGEISEEECNGSPTSYDPDDGEISEEECNGSPTLYDPDNVHASNEQQCHFSPSVYDPDNGQASNEQPCHFSPIMYDPDNGEISEEECNVLPNSHLDL